MDTSFVIAARDELLGRMENMFFQPVYRYFGSMWHESKRLAVLQAGNNPPVETIREQFLTRLSHVKNWTNTQINEQYTKVTQGKDSLFDLLISRTFIMNSRILLVAVDIPPDYLTVNVPDGSRFVHAVFINAARAFYRNPWLFVNDGKDSSSSYFRLMALDRTINEEVRRTIRELMNIDNIFHPSVTSNAPPPPVAQPQYTQPQSSFATDAVNSAVEAGLDPLFQEKTGGELGGLGAAMEDGEAEQEASGDEGLNEDDVKLV